MTVARASADRGRVRRSPAKAALAVVALVCGAYMPSAFPQSGITPNPENVVDWYYAPLFGTGIYASGDRSVGVVQLEFPHVLREPGANRTGLKLTLPVAFGFYDYDVGSVFRRGLPSSVSTVSSVPQLEWEYAASPRWTLRPYVAAGYGAELSGNERAWIHDFGVRSRYLLLGDRHAELSLLNRLTSAGYKIPGGPSDALGFIATGFDITMPTGATLSGRPLRLSVTPTHYYYFGRLDFPQFNNQDNRLREEFELAFSLSTEKPLAYGPLRVGRLGLALREGGGVTGLRIFTSLPF